MSVDCDDCKIALTGEVVMILEQQLVRLVLTILAVIIQPQYLRKVELLVGVLECHMPLRRWILIAHYLPQRKIIL